MSDSEIIAAYHASATLMDLKWATGQSIREQRQDGIETQVIVVSDVLIA